MNTALQVQLALSYDVSVNVIHNQTLEHIQIENSGHASITLWGAKFGAEKANSQPDPRVIAPGGSWSIPWGTLLPTMQPAVPKGSQKEVPYMLFNKNQHNEEFTVYTVVTFEWKGDGLTVRTRITKIVPEKWSKRYEVKA